MNRKQTIPQPLRYTINDFNRQFPDDAACLEHLKEQRFPGGVTYCEKCQQDRKHSSTSLRLWYYAMYLMASTRCGISAKQIQRETGVTYKTAWRMFRQIRSLLSEADMQLEGSAVEMDEMYYGGTSKGHSGRPMRGDKRKTPVIGIVERSSKARHRQSKGFGYA